MSTSKKSQYNNHANPHEANDETMDAMPSQPLDTNDMTPRADSVDTESELNAMYAMLERGADSED
eukprot:6371761-Amphidinium_carterae.1